MRFISILAILGLSACSISNVTARHSGAGISNGTMPAKETSAEPLSETDYRGKLFQEIGEG